MSEKRCTFCYESLGLCDEWGHCRGIDDRRLRAELAALRKVAEAAQVWNRRIDWAWHREHNEPLDDEDVALHDAVEAWERLTSSTGKDGG